MSRPERAGKASENATGMPCGSPSRNPPLDGKANRACQALLARTLGVPRAAIELDPAARGRRKRVRARGDPEQLRLRLGALAGRA